MVSNEMNQLESAASAEGGWKTVTNQKTVRMEVTVTVEPPKGQTLTDEKAIELAMSSVNQSHQVECGRDVGPHHNLIAWAKVYAEVSDHDCEVIE
jgi:hypothetical protein